MSQNDIYRNKQYHGIWKIFTVLEQKLTIFVDVLLEKTAHEQLGYLESRGRLDKIIWWKKYQSKLLASAVGIFLDFSRY